MLFDRKHNLTEKQASESMDVTVSSLMARYGIDNGHKIILYAGTFEPYQGLDLLVDAAPAVIRNAMDVRFLCLGGKDKQIAKIKARAQHRGMAEYFVFPGTVPPEDVEDCFRIASILVSPRISGTNTPLKIYSYLRSGVPILATNILSHTQVLTSEVAMLVEPQPDSFAEGILRLVEDIQLGQRLTKNAMRLAHESYSPEAYHVKVAEVCSFLAARILRNNSPSPGVARD
jgi:glycosyltransferase involved in cell wall biosynthesis